MTETISQSPPAVRLACRQIVTEDVAVAIALLAEGFPERTPEYWRQALGRLASRDVPDGYPRYGYVLADGARLVGIILLIVSDGISGRRGNVSSWYVKPNYRSFSHLLLAATLRLRQTVLINISPAPHTIATIGAQGFREYVRGAALVVPALAWVPFGVRVIEAGDDDPDELLAKHSGWGCICLKVVHGGTVHPFIFARTRVLSGRVPCAQLIFAPSDELLLKYAGALGRRLVQHGLLLLLVDASARIAGLAGVYRSTRDRRFFRGERAPRAGDLTYTELAIFGA